MGYSMKIQTPLFDDNQFLGYVSLVRPSEVRIHFPTSRLMQTFQYNGQIFNGGSVGSYVIIEGIHQAFLARVYEATLPEKERLSLSEEAFKEESNLHPFALADVHLVIDMYNMKKISKGVGVYPEVGAKVYACPPETLNELLGDQKYLNEELSLMDIAVLSSGTNNKIGLSPNVLFTRHSAVVGTTGGGKSYTVSKLIQGLVECDYNAKIVILDATGEYNFPDGITTQVDFSKDDFIDYQSLSLADLVALFKPAGQSQLPTLDDAIRSLKMIQNKNAKTIINSMLAEDGDKYNLIKEKKSKTNYLKAYNTYSGELEKLGAKYDLRALPRQIYYECVFDDRADATKWENYNQNLIGNNASLILRIRSRLNNPEWDNIFGFSQYGLSSEDKAKLSNFEDTFESFYKSNKKILRIRLDNIPSQENLHAVVVNKIGTVLLERSKRNDDFKANPVITFIDEAHRFLNVTIKDEYAIETNLDSFERIAKECRKYGLFLTIATQRPRDIPSGVLSQIGTFIVHRLINESDKAAIINAAPEGSQRSLSFISSLSAGEALILSVELASPLVVKFNMCDDNWKPNSDTPLFKVINKL